MLRRVREDPLGSPQRVRLLQAVEQEPGLGMKALGRALAWPSPSTLKHHLKVLEAAGLVRVERNGRVLSVWPTSRRFGDREEAVRNALLNPVWRRVLEAVVGGAVTQRMLEGALGVAQSVVSWHVRHLVTAGMLVPVVAESEGPGRAPMVYRVADDVAGRLGSTIK